MPIERTLALWGDLWLRYTQSLGRLWPWAGSLFLLVAAVVVLQWRGWDAMVPRWARRVAFGGLLAGALVWAGSLRWVSDDAFITFRYVRNLVRGHGLVFNPGEYVEGYTNFLWAILLAGPAALGAEPAITSLVLSLAAFAGTLYLTKKLTRALAPATTSVVVPLAAVALAFNYVMACYATSGLETMFGAFLVLLMLERMLAGQYALSGLAGILATMAHPDHAIFYASAAFVMLLDDRRRRGLPRFGAMFVIVYVPYFTWRYFYYGEFFPNTYYAKSAALAYFSQGWVYVLVCVVSTGAFAALPLAIAGAARLRDHFFARYFVFSSTLYITYVAKIGGDFMLGRLLVPALPPLFILAEVGGRHLLRDSSRFRRVAATVGLALFSLAAVPTNVIRPLEKSWHIADERSFYPLASLFPVRIDSPYQVWGEDIVKYVVDRGVRPRLAVSSVGILAWVTDLEMVDTYGLTDKTIARKPIVARGRPGHEKLASPAYLLTRDIDLSEFPVFPLPYAQSTVLWVNGARLFMPRYQPEILNPLRGQKRLSFASFPAQLDSYDPLMPGKLPDSVFCDAWFFQEYYFSTNDDEERRTRVRRKIVAADPSLSGFEGFLLGDPPARQFERVARLGFDEGEGWRLVGEAFSGGPSTEATTGQGVVFGQSGAFANSFSPKLGDLAKGRMRSKPFPIEGDVMVLRVGGGSDIVELRVSLLVEGERIFSATGCNSELLGRRVWNVTSLKGSEAVIEIVDQAEGAWGHILVDEIEQLSRAAE